MSNYKTLKEDKFVDKTDIVDSGTEGTKLATGTTAQRGSTTGQMRFNTTTGTAEYYDGSAFRSISSPPAVASVDDSEVDSGAGGNQTIVITGSNFTSTVEVLLQATSGSDITPSTVTRDSATQITIVHAKSAFVNANEPYAVKVINSSGLSGRLASAIYVDNLPAWQTSSGALSGSPFTEGDSLNVTLSATDADGDTVTYALQSGSLPSGISLNSSTGVLSGTLPGESGNTTYNFTIRATANSKTSDRAFSLVNEDDTAPTWTTASGVIATIFDSARTGVSTTVVASDAEGDTIAYSHTSGSLPSGASLNTSTGAITGNLAAVGADSTATFTIRATANGLTADRSFSIVTKAPVITSFTSNGTFTVPTGVTTATVLVVAGGGAGGASGNAAGPNRGAGGGAGGLIYIPTWNLTGSGTYSVVIGAGGVVSSSNATNGANSTVSGGSKTLTAIGGGHGAFTDGTNNHEEGGSGGGGWYPGYSGRSGTQPANTSDGVTTYNSTGYGNAGGTSSSGSPYGAGGGGAGGNGQDWNAGQQGGTGKDYSSVFGTGYGESGNFASGGTSGTFGGNTTNTRIGGGGEGHNDNTGVPTDTAANGQANTGGGGGSGGHGGSGVVLFKY